MRIAAPRRGSCGSRCSGRARRRARPSPAPRPAAASRPAIRSPPSACPACRCRIAPRHGAGRRAAARRPCGVAARPSTVVTARPAAWASGTRQAQAWAPSSSTVQAPQSPASQPTLVPVRPSWSRSTALSRVAAAAATAWAVPFTVSRMAWAVMPRPRSAASVPRRGAAAPARHGGDRRRWPARRRSAQARPDAPARRRPAAAASGSPTSAASSAGSRCATAEQAPTAMPGAADAAGRGLDHRGDHDDGDHQIGPRAQLLEPRPRAGRRLRHQHRGGDLIRRQRGLPVAEDEIRQRQPPHPAQAGQFDLGIQRQQRRHAIRGGGGVAEIADQRPAILHLRPADLGRGLAQRRRTRAAARASRSAAQVTRAPIRWWSPRSSMPASSGSAERSSSGRSTGRIQASAAARAG